MTTQPQAYFRNLWNALLGREGFQGETAPIVNPEMQKGEERKMQSFGILAVLSVLFGLVLCFMYNYGAAKLSYCYSVRTGSAGMATLYSILAFFFSGLYYPYYAWFLNPLCAVQVGGRRKLWN
jgi:hypothetical protein